MKGKAVEIVSLDGAGVIVEGSPIPLYFQLIQLIESKIRTNGWKTGWSLPSEQAFCDHFALSRTVVRQAFADLQHRGLLFKQNGKRTMIAHPSYRGSLMQKFTGFHEESELRGQSPRTRVLEFKVVKATRIVAERLRLEPDSKVILLTRLRFLGAEPQVYVKTYLNYERCAPILQEDFSNESLYRLLRQKLGLIMVKGVRTIRAIAITGREAILLEVAPRSPGLLLTSVGFLSDGTPLEYFVSKHRGDTSEFEVQLVR